MDNEILEYEPVIELLDDIFGEHRMHNERTRQLTYNCPICSYEIKNLDQLDGKFNLEINYGLGVYNCWACGESHNTRGGLYKLVKQFGSPKHLKRFLLYNVDHDDNDFYKNKDVIVRLPEEFIPFESASEGIKKTHYYKQALKYLKKRNITDDIINKYNIGFCYTGKYANRIIIPSYDDDGFVNYFIGRSYEHRPKLKYLNPEAEKEKFIWNEHLIKWDEPIYLVEGVFDSIFLPNSIPMLGKKISDKLFNLLYEKATEVIIVLDGDAHISTINLFDKLNGGKLFGKVKFILLPKDKDIADLQGNINEYKVQKEY